MKCNNLRDYYPDQSLPCLFCLFIDHQSKNKMNGGNMMKKSLITITYKTANGNRLCVKITTPVKELLLAILVIRLAPLE